MTTNIDATIKRLLDDYSTGTGAPLISERRHADDFSLAHNKLAAMQNCFDGEQITDAEMMAKLAHELGSRLAGSEQFAATAPGSNILRLCVYILQVLPNPGTPPVSQRIDESYVETRIVLECIQDGTMPRILAIMGDVLSHSAGASAVGDAFPRMVDQLIPIIENARLSQSYFGGQLLALAADARRATGGISNPWLRKVRERVAGCGTELQALVDMQQASDALGKAVLILDPLQKCFSGRSPINLRGAFDYAVQLDALLSQDASLLQTYLGSALFGISSYLVRHLASRYAAVQTA